jgi:hypothetical protein
VIITVIVVSSACGSEGDTAAAGAAFPSIPIEEDLRLDGYEEDLVPVQWLGATETGTIAVVLWQDHTVRFYSPDGALLGTVGRVGEGPGEFRRLVRAGWIGDTLWVSDTQLGRSTLISPDREIVRIVRDLATAEPATGDTASTAYLSPLPYAMLADGAILTGRYGQPTDGISPGAMKERRCCACRRMGTSTMSCSDSAMTTGELSGSTPAVSRFRFFRGRNGPCRRVAPASVY